MLRRLLEETHSTGFELRRHFFLRFFDSDLISDPAQTKVVVGGAIGILLSLSLIFVPAYYHKYNMLLAIDTRGPYDHAVLGDVLFLTTFAMLAGGLFTTLQWPALFPGLGDYLALAALPVRMRQIFVAKFTALLAVTAVVLVSLALPPSVLIPGVMVGRYSQNCVMHVPGIVCASFAGGLFVFFTLVATQGVLLNLIPIRQFARVSLAIQGTLLATLVGVLPIVFSIPDLYDHIEGLPAWSIYAPPFWFFGIDQVIFGNTDDAIRRLASMAIAALLISVAAAIAAYLWSYRRHRTRIIECPESVSTTARSIWPEILSEHLVPDPRSLGVFGFIAKTLSRSRQHRLILTAFGAIAVAIIAEGFASIALAGGKLHRISASSEGVRESVLAIPLAIALLLLAGLRYLFRLPVELRANWVFRTIEPGHAIEMLTGVERFLLLWGALPIAILALPIEAVLLGARTGVAATIASLLISLLLIEFLLFSFEKIPFTSSYLPGRKPLIETVVKLVLAMALYVWGFAGLLSVSLRTGSSALILISVLVAAWWKLRRIRLSFRQIRRLEFEEILEPAVLRLAIERE